MTNDSSSKDLKTKNIKTKNIYQQQVSANEKDTNRLVVFVSFAFIVLFALLRLEVRIDYSYMLNMFTLYYLLPACIIMLIMDGIAFVFKYSKSWIKYMLIAGIIMQCAVGFFAFTTYAFYMIFLPLILIIKYFDKKLTIKFTIIIEVVFIICCFFNFYLKDKFQSVFLFHEAAGYNSWNRIIDVAFFIFIPATVLIIFCGAYGVKVTDSGKALIRQFADNETKIALVNAELNMAAEIQKSVLPDEQFTTQDSHFIVLAKEIPAKEVGGDFYDYFMLDEHTLGVIVADVSDKGVPAAMFMMSAKKAIRCAAECCSSLEETIELANRLVCMDNKSGMFITMWLGLIDTSSGVGKYINAGHLMPIIKKDDGSVCLLENDPDLMIGSFPDNPPRVNLFRMSKNDTLILYTDGITDAMNKDGIPLEIDAVLDTVKQLPNRVEELVEGIILRDEKHMEGCEHFDDMTILGLKCVDLDDSSFVNISEKANPSGTKKFIDTVEDALIKCGCPDAFRRKVEISVDEICTNIVDYAYEGEGVMELNIETGRNFINLIFSDYGRPFNPLETDEPDLLGDPQIGGLGIYFAKTLMDYMSYEYSDGKNKLKIGLIWNI